jgi:HEAT repeat protein
LDAGDPDLRETIVRALAQIGSKVDSPRIIGTLVKAMQDEDWEVRQRAAEMLIFLDSPQREEARILLLDNIRSDDEEIRMGAAQALADVEATDVSDVLIELLDHPDLAICARAASLLGKYGSERAIPLLIPLLSHGDANLKLVVHTALRRLGYDLGSEDE